MYLTNVKDCLFWNEKINGKVENGQVSCLQQRANVAIKLGWLA